MSGNPYESPKSISAQPPGSPLPKESLFGHPAGLYTLFFAEMWERFSYYGMRALLVFYMVKASFLHYDDANAYTVYGAYTALVYMTPFFGGMLADRLLGARRAVIFGAMLMTIGEGLLMCPKVLAFYCGLGLLIVGNGFFKPNISTIVGTLYRKYPGKRDAGFTLFYMGINLGAAISPLLCGYIGETYGWQYGFGLAMVGMLIGLAVFVLPRQATGVTIVAGAFAAATMLIVRHPDELFATLVNVFVAAALMGAAVVAVFGIVRGGLPPDAGAPADPRRLRRRLGGIVPVEWAVYLGSIAMIPVFVFLVSSGATLTKDRRPMVFWKETVERLEASPHVVDKMAALCLQEVSKPAGIILLLSAVLAFGYLGFEAARLEKIARHRMYVIFVLAFFSLIFWAFFEQAGSSLSIFADRNVQRVYGAAGRIVGPEEVGRTIRLQPTQAQLGYHNGEQLFTLNVLTDLRTKNAEEKNADKNFDIPWKVAKDNVGMRIARRVDELPASLFQAANPVYILILGLTFTALWGFLGARGMEPSTPLKFAFAMVQLGLGFIAFWLGTITADQRGMVAVGWLLLGYLFHTTGELCLSPVGLAMITKLSPARLVATVMGAWFLATAFSLFLAGIIASFTSVGGDAAGASIPPPRETLHTYGDVYRIIAIAAFVAAAICFALVPLLKKWMHEGEESGN